MLRSRRAVQDPHNSYYHWAYIESGLLFARSGGPWCYYPQALPDDVTIEETPERLVLWIELKLDPYAHA